MIEDSKFRIEKLSTDEIELLVLLMEECGEVIQAAAKCMRNIEYAPHQAPDCSSNRQWLKVEVTDLQVIINKLTERNGLCHMRVEESSMLRNEKLNKLRKWTNVFKLKEQ